jgi:sulfonate transport system substrate-binding protein
VNRSQISTSTRSHARRLGHSVALGLTVTAVAAVGAGTAVSSTSGASTVIRTSATAPLGAATPAPGVAAPRASAPAGPARVTLHVGDQAGSGSESLLKAAGLLGKLPFKVSWADFTSGPPMLQAESAGSIDIGQVGDAPPVFALAGGAKLDLVEAIASDPTATGLLAPKGSDVRSVAQLKGKTIAVAQGSSSDYHLLITLKKAGLTVKDVTLEYLQPAEALAALSSGQVAAGDVWSPYVEEAEADGARVIANGTTTGTVYSFVVASDAAVTNPQKAAAIKVYLADLDKAYAWEKKHTSAWAATWSQATGLPSRVMDRATRDDISTPAPITGGVVTSEQSVADSFYRAGLVPDKVNISAAAYTGFNSLFSPAK